MPGPPILGGQKVLSTNPQPSADPKSGSTSGFCNLHHRSIRIQNWGIYILDPPGGLGREPITGVYSCEGSVTSITYSLLVFPRYCRIQKVRYGCRGLSYGLNRALMLQG